MTTSANDVPRPRWSKTQMVLVVVQRECKAFVHFTLHKMRGAFESLVRVLVIYGRVMSTRVLATLDHSPKQMTKLGESVSGIVDVLEGLLNCQHGHLYMSKYT